MDILAVIPARGGSKRVPRKNMQDVGGRPLIDWTIEAAQDAESITRVVVSTEDVAIASWAKRRGVEVVPQPLESALSGTMSAPVVLSAVNFLRDTEGYQPDGVCLLHPTSPFRTAEHIDFATELWHDAGAGCAVVSFTNDDLNGAIYLTDANTFRLDGTFFGGLVRPLMLDDKAGLDIDTWEDLERAREIAKGRF